MFFFRFDGDAYSRNLRLLAGSIFVLSFVLYRLDPRILNSFSYRDAAAAKHGGGSQRFPQFFNISRAFRFARENEVTEPLDLAVWGPGLHQASAGRTAHFFVGLPCTKQECNELYVWFQGPSIFTASDIIRNESTATVEYVSFDSGAFEIFIDVFSDFANKTVRIQRVQGVPFALVVTTHGKQAIARLSLPQVKCRNTQWRAGRWLPCSGPQCPRSGWAWVPHSCYFPFYPPTQLFAAPKPIWIVLAGSSVQRGTFYSLVDTILGPEAAANLTFASFWKCWGWMDFVQGNFRVSYLDFREERMFQGVEKPDVEARYQEHAMLAVRTLMEQNNGRGPEIFYLEMIFGRAELNDLLVIKSWFGLNWKGRFLVHLQKPPFGFPFQTNVTFQKHTFITEIERRPELRGVEYVDEQHMALPFWHTVENYPFSKEVHGATMHFHQACDEGGMHSCSPVSDMAAQMLLHAALSSLSIRGSPKRSDNADVPFEFCLSCPVELLPFSINVSRILNPSCHKLFPREQY